MFIYVRTNTHLFSLLLCHMLFITICWFQVHICVCEEVRRENCDYNPPLFFGLKLQIVMFLFSYSFIPTLFWLKGTSNYVPVWLFLHSISADIILLDLLLLLLLLFHFQMSFILNLASVTFAGYFRDINLYKEK